MITHVFVITTGFHYYFSTLLIEHLQLKDVMYVMWRPRENIDQRAAKKYPVICKKDKPFKRLGPMVERMTYSIEKFFLARKIGSILQQKNRPIRVYAPKYNETLMTFLRWQLQKKHSAVEYCMIADAGALLVDTPFRHRKPLFIAALLHYLWGVKHVSNRHQYGSYSDFLYKVYHFPAKRLFADPKKVEFIPVQPTHRPHNNEVLIIGGFQGVSSAFILAADALSSGHKIKYRLHPKNHQGEAYITQNMPHWKKLVISQTLEEHLLKNTYYKVIGHYSSSILFNHLFIGGTQSLFLIEKAKDDKNFHATADACGIPVKLI